jgi:ribosomal protein S27E
MLVKVKCPGCGHEQDENLHTDTQKFQCDECGEWHYAHPSIVAFP